MENRYGNDLQGLLADDKLYEALILLWRDVLKQTAALGAAVKLYADNPGEHDRRVQRIAQALLQDSALHRRNIPLENPLALLQALDVYLRCCAIPRQPAQKVLLDGRDYWVYPRCWPVDSRHSQQKDTIQSWLCHHWIVPCTQDGFSVSIKTAKYPLIEQTRQRRQLGRVRATAGQFGDGVTPLWLSAYMAEQLTDSELRWQAVLTLLQQACADQVHVLVMPELTLCPQLCQRVADWLRSTDHPFCLVLPGSFYVAQQKQVYNQCTLLDAYGNRVLSHRKFRRFDDNNGIESIDTGTSIDLLDTPWGLLATPICKDYCDETLGNLWSDLGVEWALVPSFGEHSSISAQQRMAEKMYRAHATASVVANQHPNGLGAAPGFVCGRGNGSFGKPMPITPEQRYCDILFPLVNRAKPY